MASVFPIANEIVVRNVVAEALGNGWVTAVEIEEELKKIVQQERDRRNANVMSQLWSKEGS